MGSDVTDQQRRLVARRARNQCEYCLLHEDAAYSPHQIDHVVSRKHGGNSDLENLAFACVRYNVYKGSDIASLDERSGTLVRLFNPRRDVWAEHFVVNGAVIEPLTLIGEATARLLRLNQDQRAVERQVLARAGRYPR